MPTVGIARRLRTPVREQESADAAVASEQRDEIAPLHSITSSARARSEGGTSRPSALAVFRLMTELKFGLRLHRQIGGFLALEDAIDIRGSAAVLVNQIGPVGH